MRKARIYIDPQKETVSIYQSGKHVGRLYAKRFWLAAAKGRVEPVLAQGQALAQRGFGPANGNGGEVEEVFDEDGDAAGVSEQR